jgi:hypothetical protein
MLLHPILLSGQGIMIGELLRLAELVASPPSAVAIF